KLKAITNSDNDSISNFRSFKEITSIDESQFLLKPKRAENLFDRDQIKNQKKLMKI
ncbi:6825_t:CDS:1, partial [Racocetra fulgida]